MDTASARELFILGRICARPTHGHEIMRTLYASRSDLWVDISRKHVYYVLRKLERDGLVTAEESREGNLPARKIYTATEAGRGALSAMLRADALVRSVSHSDFDVVLGMLGYSDALSDSEKNAVLERRAAFLTETIASARAAAEESASGPGAAPIQRVVLGKVVRLAEAELEWLSDTRAEIAQMGWAAMAPQNGGTR
jgi:DNA-binding PadR family transcriptional regulator